MLTLDQLIAQSALYVENIPIYLKDWLLHYASYTRADPAPIMLVDEATNGVYNSYDVDEEVNVPPSPGV